MTFSPEDAYASNIPVPGEDQFDTGGLELEPLGGDEGEAGPLDGYTAEEQAADAKLYSVVENPTTEEVTEVESAAGAEKLTKDEALRIKAEALELRLAAKAQEDVYVGEVKAALMNGNVEAAQTAFGKVVEARIQQAEFEIAALEADFAGGEFQNRGKSEDPSVKSIYEGQVNSQQQIIESHKRRLEYSQTDPKNAFAAEGWDALEGSGDAAYEIRKRIQTAEGYQAEEAKGYTFASYNGELIGMISSSLEEPNMSQDLKSAIKEAGRKVTNIPNDLKQKIDSLN